MKSNKIDLDCINHPDFDLFKTNYPVRSRDLFIGKDDYDFLEGLWYTLEDMSIKQNTHRK